MRSNLNKFEHIWVGRGQGKVEWGQGTVQWGQGPVQGLTPCE